MVAIPRGGYSSALPASVDLGGVFITPVEKDFLKITAEDVAQILSEVCVNATDFEDIRKRIQEQI